MEPAVTEMKEEAPKAAPEVAEFLIDLGEEMGDEWELIDARRVDYEEEENMNALWTFARAIPGSSAERSKPWHIRARQRTR